MMKKTAVLVVTLLTMVLFFAACGTTSNAYYPLDELNSNGINEEALSYFKKQILASDALDCERVAIKIGSMDGYFYVDAYALDETGLFLKSYPIEGDMVNDIIDTFFLDEYSFPQEYYTYEMYISYLESEDGVLVANRTIDHSLLESNVMMRLKEQLIKAGYPDREFSVNGNSLYYGKFQVSGDAELDVMNILYGFAGNISTYSFSDSYGIIKTVDIG